jgi:hypothetical protein
MLNSYDLSRMRSDATAIRSDRPDTITLWRQVDGSEDASFEQEVRLCYITNQPITRQSPQGDQVTIPLLVKGPVDLDIEKDDRFTHEDIAYVIDLVRPDRDFETTAEARVVR